MTVTGGASPVVTRVASMDNLYSAFLVATCEPRRVLCIQALMQRWQNLVNALCHGLNSPAGIQGHHRRHGLRRVSCAICMSGALSWKRVLATTIAVPCGQMLLLRRHVVCCPQVRFRSRFLGRGLDAQIALFLPVRTAVQTNGALGPVHTFLNCCALAAFQLAQNLSGTQRRTRASRVASLEHPEIMQQGETCEAGRMNRQVA